MKNLNLKPKTIGAFLLVAIIPCLVVGISSIIWSSSALEELAFNQLISVRDGKKSQIESYFKQVKIELEILAASENEKQSFLKFKQYHDDTQTPSDGNFDISTSAYKEIWNELSEFIDKYTDEDSHGFYDVFLICAAHGHVMFTAAKESDLGENLVHGKYKDSGLAEVRRKVIQTRKTAYVDFKPYAPSNGEPAAFVGSPIYIDSQMVGVLVFQLSIDKINKIMYERSGMGETGESYLVGPDLLMRSDSYLDPDNHSVVTSFKNPSKGKIDTEASRHALSGKTDAKIIEDYMGNPVLSAYTPVQFGEIKWGLMSEIDQAEAFQSISQMRIFVIVLGVIIIILVIIVAFIFANSIANPLKKLADAIISVEKEVDFSVSAQVKTNDEVGQASNAFNTLVNSLKVAMGNIIEVMEKLSNGDLRNTLPLDQKGEIQKLNTAINNSIELLGETISQVSIGTSQVATSAEQLSSSSQELASGASEQAANLEETSSSLSEIESQTKSNNENAEQAKQISNETLSIAQKSNAQMEDMLSSMNEINQTSAEVAKVIKVIDDIAFQTNLLALNAAVEAARAGQYGKGFAVVAEEVRSLAARSAEAAKNTTELIDNSVRQVEIGVTNANKTAEMQSEIIDAITRVNDIIQEIAAASVEQARGIGEINTGMSQVNQIVQQNSSISEETAAASEELTGQSTQMQNLVSQFKIRNSGSSGMEKSSSPVVRAAQTIVTPVKEPLLISEQEKTEKAMPPIKADTKKHQIFLDDDDFGKY